MTDYANIATKSGKLAEVQTAGTVEELDGMWAVWEGQGWSREGQMYAAVLEAKQALGAELSADEKQALGAIRAAVREGGELPPIHGSFSP